MTSIRSFWRTLEQRYLFGRILKPKGLRKNFSSVHHLKYLFIFPFSAPIFASSNYSKYSCPLQRPSSSTVEIKSYSSRGSVVKYIYKTWDLIRFLLRLAKFALLFSPFLLTYPICFLSTRTEDLWWFLFKKAIVLGGPVTVEFAKWLGTREDLFLHKTCLNLASVSHRDNPHSWYSSKKKFRRAFGKEWNNTVVQFDPPRKEIHNSELAQVYKARIPLDACSDQVAEEIVRDVDDFEGLEEPFLSDGIEIVGLGAWMSGHDEDDIVDNAFGSWMMTKQGLAQSKMENEEQGVGIRSCPVVNPPSPDVIQPDSSPPDSGASKKLLRERIRDRLRGVQHSAAEKIVQALENGMDKCNRVFARSYALMAKVGTMRQELQIVPDPFDLTPAIPPKPVAESVAVDELEDKLYLEELLPETQEDIAPSAGFAISMENSSSNSSWNNNRNEIVITKDARDIAIENDSVEIGEVANTGEALEATREFSVQIEEYSKIKIENTEVAAAVSADAYFAVEKDSSDASAPDKNLSPDDGLSSDTALTSDSEYPKNEGVSGSPLIPIIVPEIIFEEVEMVAQEEIREKIPELTPEEVAIHELVEGTEETQPHIPESVSEGVEALIHFGAEAVKSAKDGMKEGVAQMKESVSPFSDTDTSSIDWTGPECEDSVLLQYHPSDCFCRLCQGLVPVAIKVLHPGIVRKSIRELDVLHLLASFVQLIPWMSWWKPAICVEEFADRLHRMVNLKREALALERFNINFAADPHVRFPRPMRPYVNRDVMVEMWEESENIQHYLTDQGEEDRSSMPYSLRSALAEIISDALVKMIFTDNYVHCDINERNVLVQNGQYFIDNPPDKDKLIQVEVMDTIVIATEENKNPLRLIFCDADVASHISRPKAFADIFEGLLKRDPSISAGAFDPFIAVSSQSKDLTSFREELVQCFQRHSTSRDGVSPDLTLLVEDIYRVLYYNKVKMEDDFVAVLTSMLAVETIGRKLIGNDQNLFHAIEKHFAMQFKKEQI